MSAMVKESSLSVASVSLRLTAPVAVVLVRQASAQAPVPQLRRARPGAGLCPTRDFSGHREMGQISSIKQVLKCQALIAPILYCVPAI